MTPSSMQEVKGSGPRRSADGLSAYEDYPNALESGAGLAELNTFRAGDQVLFE
jgi:hypothetical protein